MTSGIPCVLAGLGVFVDVVAGGAVAGTGSGDDLDTVAARLGENYIDDRNGRALRRDYGLVEFAGRPGAPGSAGRATGTGPRRPKGGR